MIETGSPCFIIAEAGVNHNGDLEIAHKLVDAAAEAKADAVKFQTWITEKICLPGTKKAQYQQVQDGDDRDQFEMLKSLELPRPWHHELKAHALERGILFLSTPDEIESARFLCQLGLPALKVGSGELNNLLFLDQLAQLGKPMLLSTGMGSSTSVSRALERIRKNGPVPVALLHCVSAYPAPEEEMNLLCLTTMRWEYEIPVGLSDHTLGSTAALLGVGQQMALLEKHITLDRKLPGPDHAASIEPDQFEELVEQVRRAEKMMGSGLKEPTSSEDDAMAAVRRSLVFRIDLSAGHTLQMSDFHALRCGGGGLPPDAVDELVGRTLRRSVDMGAIVNEEDLR